MLEDLETWDVMGIDGCVLLVAMETWDLMGRRPW